MERRRKLKIVNSTSFFTTVMDRIVFPVIFLAIGTFVLDLIAKEFNVHLLGYQNRKVEEDLCFDDYRLYYVFFMVFVYENTIFWLNPLSNYAWYEWVILPLILSITLYLSMKILYFLGTVMLAIQNINWNRTRCLSLSIICLLLAILLVPSLLGMRLLLNKSLKSLVSLHEGNHTISYEKVELARFIPDPFPPAAASPPYYSLSIQRYEKEDLILHSHLYIIGGEAEACHISLSSCWKKNGVCLSEDERTHIHIDVFQDNQTFVVSTTLIIEIINQHDYSNYSFVFSNPPVRFVSIGVVMYDILYRDYFKSFSYVTCRRNSKLQNATEEVFAEVQVIKYVSHEIVKASPKSIVKESYLTYNYMSEGGGLVDFEIDDLYQDNFYCCSILTRLKWLYSNISPREVMIPGHRINYFLHPFIIRKWRCVCKEDFYGQFESRYSIIRHRFNKTSGKNEKFKIQLPFKLTLIPNIPYPYSIFFSGEFQDIFEACSKEKNKTSSPLCKASKALVDWVYQIINVADAILLIFMVGLCAVLILLVWRMIRGLWQSVVVPFESWWSNTAFVTGYHHDLLVFYEHQNYRSREIAQHLIRLIGDNRNVFDGGLDFLPGEDMQGSFEREAKNSSRFLLLLSSDFDDDDMVKIQLGVMERLVAKRKVPAKQCVFLVEVEPCRVSPFPQAPRPIQVSDSGRGGKYYFLEQKEVERFSNWERKTFAKHASNVIHRLQNHGFSFKSILLLAWLLFFYFPFFNFNFFPGGEGRE